MYYSYFIILSNVLRCKHVMLVVRVLSFILLKYFAKYYFYMKYEYLWGQVRISEFRIQYFFLEYCKILWTCVLSNKVLSVHEHVLCLFMCSQFYTFLFHIVCSGKERLWRKWKVNNNIRCIIITYKVNNVYIYLCTKD